MITQFRGENFFLSNFFEHPVTFDGITYNTSEGAYQAQKLLIGNYRNKIMAFALASPRDAKIRGGRKGHFKIRPDWDSVRVPIMARVIQAKFNPIRYPEMASMLLDTGDEELVEGNEHGDDFWGAVWKKGEHENGWLISERMSLVGENHLGLILMSTRARIRLMRASH